MTDVTPAPRVRTRLTPERRREQVVAEATRLISVAGFNAVSLADIAEACGIRKSSVLHYFPTMNDLLAAVLAQRDEDAGTEHLVAELDSPQAVRRYLRRAVERNIASREMVRLFIIVGTEALDPQHPAHAHLAQRRRLALQEVEGMLSWKADPALAAVQLLAFWQGLEALWIGDPGLDYLAVWDDFCDGFFPDTVRPGDDEQATTP